MVITSRKKRPLDRSVGHHGDTRLIIIAAEGHETEKQYFSLVNSTRVQVQVLATGDDNTSSPTHVIERLREFGKIYELDGNDELWLMIDVDRWGGGKLAQIAKEATASNFGLAVSNPCFEVWLLYHFREEIVDTARCRDVESWLREALGGSYNKSRLELDQFYPFVQDAIVRSTEQDKHPGSRWPQQTGSHVYRVFRNIPLEGQ